jgi:hypothetical protein
MALNLASDSGLLTGRRTCDEGRKYHADRDRAKEARSAV